MTNNVKLLHEEGLSHRWSRNRGGEENKHKVKEGEDQRTGGEEMEGTKSEKRGGSEDEEQKGRTRTGIGEDKEDREDGGSTRRRKRGKRGSRTKSGGQGVVETKELKSMLREVRVKFYLETSQKQLTF